jgi:hypothetical protein
MKKLYGSLFIAILLLSVDSLAQYATRGTTELGGTISYSSTTAVTNGTTASESTSLFNFLPYVGYFISDGLAIGLSPGINIVKLAGSKESVKNLLLFLVPGYTFGTKGSLYPFVEGLVGYTSLVSKVDPLTGVGEMDLSGISYGARAGIRVLVGKSGLANISVAYMLYTLNPKNATKRSGYNSLAINLGFSVFIGK